MSEPSKHQLLIEFSDKLRFFGPATENQIDDAEIAIGRPFPNWLRDIYLSCNGLRGPTMWISISTLDGVINTTKSLQIQFPNVKWLSKSIVFGANSFKGKSTIYYAILEGQLIEWCIDDGSHYTKYEGSIIELFKREYNDRYGKSL